MDDINDNYKLIAAVLTPLTTDGELNLHQVEAQAEMLWNDGIRSVFVGGTTGEFSSLTLEERIQLGQRWLEVSRQSGMRVLIHVGSNSLEESRWLAVQARKGGAVGIAALSPQYLKPAKVDDLIECCAYIAAAAPDLPFCYYHIPALTGVSWPLADWIERASVRVANLSAIKFTHSDLLDLQWIVQNFDKSMQIFYGMDEQLLAAWVLGVRAAIGSGYNFAAPWFRLMLQAAQRGNWTLARQLQWRIADLTRRMLSIGYLAAAKELLRLRGLDLGPVRLPLRTFTPEQADLWRHELERENIEELWSPSFT
jgi:N-acetylneuraminate lyase